MRQEVIVGEHVDFSTGAFYETEGQLCQFKLGKYMTPKPLD